MNSKLRALLGAVIVAGSLAFVPLTAFATSWPTSKDVNQCQQLNLQNPHDSGPPYGALVKSQWQCFTEPATIHLNTAYTGSWLWLCPSAGPQDENWITSACTYKGGCFSAPSIPFNGGNIATVWIPCQGANVTGSGWWVACTEWYSSGVNGNGNYYLTFSNYVPLTVVD